MLVALDGTVLIIAQPSLQRDLAATTTQVQWTSTGYLLAVAALLVVAGRLGDRHGHRRLLLLGVLGFAAASAGIALAPGVGWVIGLRVLQGVFGALLQPATLALLRQAYPADLIGSAVAVRTSAIGLSAAAGPLLGGILVDHLGWRAVFVLNLPIAAAVAVAALALRLPGPDPSAAPPGPRRLDLAGAALLATALALLVHTLAGVPEYGWRDPRTLGGAAGTVLLGALLVGHECRTPDPVVPAAVARSGPLAASMALLLCASGALFGALFVATFRLQDGAGLGPLESALQVLPLTVLMVLASPVAARAVRRLGARATAVAGAGLVLLGAAGLARYGADAGRFTDGAVFALLGAGFAAVMVTATGTVVGEAPPAYAGVVGGLKQTAVNIGPTLGIALAAGLSVPGGPPSQAGMLGPVALAALGLLPAALLPGRTRRGATAGGTSANLDRTAASTVPAPTPPAPTGSSSTRP
ncbi:MFS transporter [Kitasatospora sp. NPDC054939]